MSVLKLARWLTMILLLPGLWSCGEAHRSWDTGEVGLALKKELRDNQANNQANNQAKEVTIAKLTRFAWDELFLFNPYTPSSEVCKRVHVTASDCKAIIADESKDDGEMMMVFRIKGKVAHSELHHRSHGDFTPAPAEPFTPQTAIFSVVAESTGTAGADWLKLRPKSVGGS